MARDDKHLDKLRDGQPDGIGNKSNLKAWSDYAKGNSYMPDRAQLRHDIGTEVANADYRRGDDKDWKQPQRNDSESRYWSDPVNKAAMPNTYTGKGGLGGTRPFNQYPAIGLADAGSCWTNGSISA